MSLSVRGLAFRYRNFELRVPELTFEKAKLTAIVGPNGAGKTTLLKCLVGLFPLPPGTVHIDGLDLEGMSEPSRARRLAFVPQEHGLSFNYSVLDFVLMGRAAHLPVFGVPSGDDARIARDALAYVGCAGFADRPMFQLSSGERRGILIARALAQQTELLVLDEPTTFLDPRHETEVMKLARRLTVEKGRTILMTLHNLDMAVRYADRLVIVKAGRLVAQGPPADILTDELLTAVYELPMRLREIDGQIVILK